MVEISDVHHNGISTCVNKLFEKEIIEKIESLFALLYNDKEEEIRKSINDIDNRIGGNNLLDLLNHPVLERSDNGNKRVGYTGLYKIEDREIFRPIQYSLICFEVDNSHLHRYSVHMSCVHVEAVYKRLLQQHGFSSCNLPLGQLINKFSRCKIETVNDEIISLLQDITSIYNIAKHDCSNDTIPFERRGKSDPMMFTLAETVFMFFICRKVALLLDPSITSNDRWRIELKNII
jgi:hypothetical protein